MARPTAAVVHADERPEMELPGSNGWVRVMVDRSTGATHLLQRIFRFEPGHTPELHNETSEDVMFVVSGIGTVDLGTASVELAPGTAVYAPAAVAYRIENQGPHDLVLVSVLSPPPGAVTGHVGNADARGRSTGDPGAGTDPAGDPGAGTDPAGDRPVRYWVREEDQETLPAGDDRAFRVLVDPAIGSRNVTQFVGYIHAVPAPPHVHTYEEAVHVLGGDGIVEFDDEVHPIGPGSSVFIPPGVPHRLASAGSDTLRILGVFSPAGSPASKNDIRT
jgi:mannose-6-phosphate isomerase-like protein (cupin superfamily)